MPGKAQLVVGRDRAHVKSLLKLYPLAQVVSASAFFDKVRMLAFLEDEGLRRDDRAPTILAQKMLSEHHILPIHMSRHLARLYGSFLHGTKKPSSVRSALADDAQGFLPVIDVLCRIDEAMDSLKLVTGIGALFCSWQLIDSSRADWFFRPGMRVSLFHLIDLTMLEIEVIKSLSRRGVRFDIYFPLDFQKRGINVAVDFVAQQFERSLDLTNVELCFEDIADHGPLRPLVQGLFHDDVQKIVIRDGHASIAEAIDVINEAEVIASSIATILTESPGRSIAIAVRRFDDRSDIYKRAIRRLGIAVRDRKGSPLLATDGGSLLSTIFSARRWSLPKKDLIGLLNHPLFCLSIADEKRRCRYLSLIAELGIDDRLLPGQGLDFRYLDSLCRYKTFLAGQEKDLSDVLGLESWLTDVLNLLALLPELASFGDHLGSLLRVIDGSMAAEQPSVDAIKKVLRSMLKSEALAPGDPPISLTDFFSIITSELMAETIPNPDIDDLGAVEFLLLPELVGRSFDHVFIADISAGRLPENQKPDPLLDDAARLMINKAMKTPVLRVYLDDPFEPLPVPPRQALEPFWFAAAIASARMGVHFSYAKRDEGGQDQAPSEFFLWLKEHLSEGSCERSVDYVSREFYRFLKGGLAARSTDEPCVFKRALAERRVAFREERPGAFAFSFDSDELIDRFEGRLAKRPRYPLTSTMVEAFALCRFRGLSRRIIGVEREDEEIDDVHMTAIGQIAHLTLEEFNQRCRSSDYRPEALKSVLEEVANRFLAKNFVTNLAVFLCHIEWLGEALVRLIQQIDRRFLGRTVAQEVSFGFKRGDRSLIITVGDREYLLGGRLDRIDRDENGLLVIDYKLSSLSRLKEQSRPSEFLRSHFQAPLYMRLAAHHFEDRSVRLSFASIRDGDVLPPIGGISRDDLSDRIFDDGRPDGLAHAIDRIFAPLRRGNALASAGDHCLSCELSNVCRRAEGCGDGL